MEFLPKYDELWAVSDLHIGGENTGDKNFQIFRRGERLGNFIRYLIANNETEPGKKLPAGKLALVLNGDVIDSLAEDIVPGYVALDITVADEMMKHIFTDKAFKHVWTALRDFVHTPNRELIIIIGNHDIELALTVVEAAIRNQLTEGNVEADRRIRFCTHGGGFGCFVGQKRVFCTHGNEVDSWNTVDYNELGQLDNAIVAGRRVDSNKWVPNAGTRIVIDLMNQAKARFPFVDLLKPETSVAMRIVLALDPSLANKIETTSAFKIAVGKVSGLFETSQLLSAQASLDAAVPNSSATKADLLLSVAMAEHTREVRAEISEDELLIAAEVSMIKGESPLLKVGMGGGATLSVFGDIVSGVKALVDPLRPKEILRNKLASVMGGDKTFQLDDPDDTYKQIIARAGPNVDFVVTGHTHLARAIEKNGKRYFNCGTWIRLMRLTTQSLASAEAFEKKVYDVLVAGSMDVLDKAKIPGKSGDVPLILDRTTAVRIFRDGTEVKGELLRVTGGETPEFANQPVPIQCDPEKGGLEE